MDTKEGKKGSMHGDSPANRWVTAVGIVVAAVAICLVVWMKLVWNSPPSPGGVQGAVVEPLGSHRLPMTPARQAYLDDIREGAQQAHSSQDWMAFERQLFAAPASPPSGVKSKNASASNESPANEASTAAVTKPTTLIGSAKTSTNPGYHIRINASSTASMIQSINTITRDLPDQDARTFQRSLRQLMVASLPIAKMIRHHVPASALTEARMLSGVKGKIGGLDAQEVVQAAGALHKKLEREKAAHAGPFAPLQP